MIIYIKYALKSFKFIIIDNFSVLPARQEKEETHDYGHAI